MRLKNAEMYLRWRFGTCHKIIVNQKDLEAINCLLKSATWRNEDEVGYKSFCLLWLSQMLHYDTEPADRVIQKELVRSLDRPTSAIIHSISRTLRGALQDRFVDCKDSLVQGDLETIDYIQSLYTPVELDTNLRQLYAQLKVLCNV